MKQRLLLLLMILFAAGSCQAQKPVNIIFILADDHRYDAMGFMNKIQGLQTPGLNRMAAEGAHLKTLSFPRLFVRPAAPPS